MPLLTIFLTIFVIVYSVAVSRNRNLQIGTIGSRKIWVLFLSLILVEKIFLIFYLVPLSTRQDEVFQRYLEKSVHFMEVEWRDKSMAYKVLDCEYNPIFIIYEYSVCAYYGNKDDVTGEMSAHITLVPPSGYFSLVPMRYGDRVLWDGIEIFEFNENGTIYEDHRSSQGY